MWKAPLELGKWSVSDVIAHILLWDTYFEQEAISKIAKAEALTLTNLEFPFNQNAVLYARAHRQQVILDQAVAVRERIIDYLEKLSNEARSQVYLDGEGHPFTVQHYLDDFIEHDNHHRSQIERLLAS
ncbi:DinB family protein [Paenibacillus solisilvae]|uniref:DinB family protein n=1 Tax=Paenibacillus solisilvae TaxID=2486751 RepID=A0ABW0VUT6_9BACL